MIEICPSAIGDAPFAHINFNSKEHGWSVGYPTTGYEGSHDPVYDQILSTFRFVE